MPPLKIATWNINSVRLRIEQVSRFVFEHAPDVLCLQEIKCRDGEFPIAAFAKMGLRHHVVVGQKGYHGVAIASRHKLEPVAPPPFCPHGEARVAAAKVKGVTLHNLYVPAGGEVADPETNDKFAHKLAVLDRMRAHYAAADKSAPLMVLGDLNIAPGEHDVWNHKQLLDVVSHTPVETDGLEAARIAGGLVDVARMHRPEPEKLYTWWSYRAADWMKANRGRRLDHIWASQAIAAQTRNYEIHSACRGWERPSDHAPVMVSVQI